MGAVVSKRGAIGQWGSRLFVSTPEAEEVCARAWGVPAEVADIRFAEQGTLRVDSPPPLVSSGPSAPPSISVGGWAATRSAADGGVLRGGLPVLWTPQIKALWAPLVPLPQGAAALALPLHRLRLSARSLRLHACGQAASDALGISLPVGLSVDGVRIEIGRAHAQL